jgi:uncharacterized protein (DUF1800 family)
MTNFASLPLRPFARLGAQSALLGLVLLLGACGGGGSGPSDASASAGVSAGSTAGSSADTSSTTTAGTTDAGATVPQEQVAGTSVTSAAATSTTHADAFRLLTQATFGPTDADVAHAMSIGAAAWVDEQLAKPVTTPHLARWNADNALLAAQTPAKNATPFSVASSFYQQAITAPDSLRQRVALALSEIFVVSTQGQGLGGQQSQTVASYLDMLDQNAFGTYRNLLQSVALHPAMGVYLSTLGNRKEDPTTGRVPDQNFAREVMQLMSIGLVQLNADGSPKLSAQGVPVPTYTQDDIFGLSKVFTGFSWSGPDTSSARFYGTNAGSKDPLRYSTPMQAYPAFHSTSQKAFLGVVVPVQAVADPMASLKVALDTLAGHPNVGPFIGRQLIQRLVTSNPSPAYVARVAAVFANNGAGVRGDLKAVVRAILLDTEARDPSLTAGATYGKLREPVLRLTALLRAFGAKSATGSFLIQNTDDPSTSLGQTPLASSSVFNFFRPGFVPDSGAAAALGLTVPEMQITTETSVAGYANMMMGIVSRGSLGLRGWNGTAASQDVQLDFTSALALGDQPAALVDLVCGRLLGDYASAALKTQITAAVTSVAVPALNKAGTNQNAINVAHLNRVQTAVLLALVSPEFNVQK